MNKNNIYVIGGGVFSILGTLLFTDQLFLKFSFLIIGVASVAYGILKETKKETHNY